MKKIMLPVLLAGLVAAGCSDKKPHTPTTPLPSAYPRLPLPDNDTMRTVSETPSPVNVNSTARATFTPGDMPALTVEYPRLGATAYWTFIPYTGTPAEIIARRRERISLNLNGTPARTLHSAPTSDFEAVLVTAEAGSQTPVQMLAVTPEYVITATAFLSDPRAAVAYDSIRPLIELLDRDMQRSIPGLIFESR